jgi:2-keto-4-pentenoate hydratase/2-oxohepta-3-ene-1,7-dioic acid hydratase in catechol pathway
MQFVRYSSGGGGHWGVLDGDTVHSLADAPVRSPSLQDVTTESYRDHVGRLADEGALTSHAVDDVRLLAPVPEPGKIVCVGMNYRDHAEEQDEEIPEKPLLFGKAPTAVTNPSSPIRIPPGIEEVDYEVELGVVIGREAHRVDAADAADHIAGYTVVDDVSGRDAQFDVYDLVEYISHAMTLRPGDVISTGTPGGVGIFRDPPELLEAGDDVEAEIDGIGTLSNPVVDGT